MKRKYLDNRPIIRLLSQRSLDWDIWDPNWFEEAYTPYFLCKGYQKLLQSSSRLVRVSAPEDQGCSLDVTQSDFTFFKMQIKMTYDVERIFNIISESEVQWSWQKGKVIIGGEGSVRTWHGSRGLSFPHPCLRLCRGLWVWLHQEIDLGGTLGIKPFLFDFNQIENNFRHENPIQLQSPDRSGSFDTDLFVWPDHTVYYMFEVDRIRLWLNF